jgi:hypothetical protein
MHVAPQVIWIIVVPAKVTVLLGLCNPPCSWTGTVGPSLSGLTITTCVDSFCAIGGLSLSFKIVPKSKVCVCIYTITFELSYSSLG